MKHANHLLAAAAMVAASIAMPAVATELSPVSEKSSPSVTDPSLQQWNDMAKAEAGVLAQKLKAHPGPWRVAVSAQNKSQFAAAFSKMLVSGLSDHGVTLTSNPNAAAVIELQVDALKQRSYYPVVQGLRDFVDAGVDVVQLKTEESIKKPHAELAVTLVATSNGSIIASTTNLYVLAKKSVESYTDPVSQTLKFSK